MTHYRPLPFALLALALAALAAAAPQGSSEVCTFSCPPVDRDNFVLSTSERDGAVLRCQYPDPPGPSGLFFCDYSILTGSIVLDHDHGCCSSTAVAQCETVARRAPLPQSPRHAGTLDEREPIPDMIQVRNRLARWMSRAYGVAM